jgi:hypothetical protein
MLIHFIHFFGFVCFFLSVGLHALVAASSCHIVVQLVMHVACYLVTIFSTALSCMMSCQLGCPDWLHQSPIARFSQRTDSLLDSIIAHNELYIERQRLLIEMKTMESFNDKQII